MGALWLLINQLGYINVNISVIWLEITNYYSVKYQEN